MAAQKPTVMIIGSLNADIVTYTPRVPQGGETLTASAFNVGQGGKGANQAVACAKLSRSKQSVDNGTAIVKMVGAVGSDSYGEMLCTGLAQVGIDVTGVQKRADEKTGVAVIIVEEQTGENRIMFCPHANYSLTASDFTSLPAPLPDLVILQLEIPLEAVLQILAAAQKQGIDVLLNPAPALKDFPKSALSGLAHLVVNETEAAILSGHPESELETQIGREEVAKGFHANGVKNVLITLGGQGVFYSNIAGVLGHVPAEKVTVVDTTAAGDTFVGAYALEAAKARGGMDIKQAVRIAARAAAKTVQRRGAAESIPWLDELQDAEP